MSRRRETKRRLTDSANDLRGMMSGLRRPLEPESQVEGGRDRHLKREPRVNTAHVMSRLCCAVDSF